MNARIHAAALAAAASIAALSLAGPPFAEPATDGKTLRVPSAHAQRGTVYYNLTDRDPQIFFTSDAPGETIHGQSNEVIGYAVAGNNGELHFGEWHLPVESLNSGIPLRDEHLAGADWLDAENHPDIVFQFAEFRGPTLSKRRDNFRTFRGTLVGEMTMHGVSNEMVIEDAIVTFLDESDATRRIAPGDLMAIRVKYSVRLSDHGVTHPTVPNRVSDEVEINTTLYLTSARPSQW